MRTAIPTWQDEDHLTRTRIFPLHTRIYILYIYNLVIKMSFSTTIHCQCAYVAWAADGIVSGTGTTIRAARRIQKEACGELRTNATLRSLRTG